MTAHPHAELAGDYHVHSTFSDDGFSTLAENVAAAHAAGLSVVRLTEHVRMSSDWIPTFVAAVAELDVPLGLTVFTGVEAKILDSSGAVDVPSALPGIDGIVIADHQFPSPDGPWLPHEVRRHLDADLTEVDALDLLISGLTGAMRRYPGNQLAHCFSILPKIGLDERDLSDAQLAYWASVAAETATVVEVNEKWGCPGPRALRAVLDAGGVIVASTDAHEAGDVGRYDRVVALLNEARS
jgi:putative hydrolase